MTIRFKHLAVLYALLFSLLAIMWMFLPDRVLSGWAVGFTPEVALISRRSASLYAGVAVMFFLARNAEASVARSALISGLVVICLFLAAIGIFEFATGHAGTGILSAVLAEVLIPCGFLLGRRG